MNPNRLTPSIPSVSITAARTGASTKANAMGMRAMQERVYAFRGEQYLLIKSPPASGKSRATYPDLSIPRDENFMIVEILWSVGRSVKVKRALLIDLMSRLSKYGIDGEHVMVCFKETAWENGPFAGGRLLHA